MLKIANDEFVPTQYPLLSNKTEEQQNEILKSIILDSFINFDFCSDEIKTSLKNFYNSENQNSSLDYIETANLSKNNSLFIIIICLIHLPLSLFKFCLNPNVI